MNKRNIRYESDSLLEERTSWNCIPFLDAVDVINNKDLSKESEDCEKAEALEARKHALGKDFSPHFPGISCSAKL